MALNWNWNEKVGEATLVQKQKGGDGKRFTIDLYQGNAFLIAIYRFKTEEDEKEDTFHYTLHGFFCDKEHAKRCLGLAKGYTVNSWGRADNGISYFEDITLYRNRIPKQDFKDLVTLFAQADFGGEFRINIFDFTELDK